jgi:tetratricopeptide (TPR) repeat protein
MSNAVAATSTSPSVSRVQDPENQPPPRRPAPATNATEAVGFAAAATRSNTTSYPYATFAAPQPGDRTQAARLLNEGVQAQRASRLQEALEKYRAAAEVDPSLFEAHYNRGVAAFESGELGEALRAYERALSLNGTSVAARFNFALTLERSGYHDTAAQELETLLAAYPNEIRAHLTLGNLYATRLKDDRKAREHYRRLLELDPQHPQAGPVRFWLETHP